MSHTRSGAVGRVRGREDSMGVGRISRLETQAQTICLRRPGLILRVKEARAEANYPPAVYTITVDTSRMFLSPCVDVIFLFR